MADVDRLAAAALDLVELLEVGDTAGFAARLVGLRAEEAGDCGCGGGWVDPWKLVVAVGQIAVRRPKGRGVAPWPGTGVT